MVEVKAGSGENIALREDKLHLRPKSIVEGDKGNRSRCRLAFSRGKGRVLRFPAPQRQYHRTSDFFN
jgi:hypothetical protein